MRWTLIPIRAFESAYRSVNAVKWKSMISMTTIFIGSLAITTTFTISKNVDSYVDHLIDKNGGPRVSAVNFSSREKFSNLEIQKLKKISIIKKVFATDETSVNVRRLHKNITLQLNSVDENNWLHLPYTLKSGVFVSPLDNVHSSNTIVLSKQALTKLEFVNGIGEYINVKLKGGDEIRLKVVGVAELTGNSNDRGTGWVNFSLYRELTGKKAMAEIHIISTGSKWMNWVESFGVALFKEKFGSEVWFNNPLAKFEKMKNQLGAFIKMGYILGFLALIAGSIGSTSIMILNVNLRRREIGLYKSMGFSPTIILIQFTCETLIMSVIAGTIGGIFGSILGLLISKDMFPVAEMSLTGFLLGISSALATGLCFGLIPAILAARTDPVKALQG